MGAKNQARNRERHELGRSALGAHTEFACAGQCCLLLLQVHIGLGGDGLAEARSGDVGPAVPRTGDGSCVGNCRVETIECEAAGKYNGKYHADDRESDDQPFARLSARRIGVVIVEILLTWSGVAVWRLWRAVLPIAAVL